MKTITTFSYRPNPLEREQRMKLYALTGLKQGRYPAWVRRLAKQHGDWLPFSRLWLDHCGSIRQKALNEEERDCFISQPYGLGRDAIQALLDDAQRFRFDFESTGRSAWHPGTTFAIICWPRQAEAGRPRKAPAMRAASATL